MKIVCNLSQNQKKWRENKYIFDPPENRAGDYRRLGEGKEWYEVWGEDPKEENIAELPPRGHDDRDLVVDKEHREDLEKHYYTFWVLDSIWTSDIKCSRKFLHIFF